MKILAIIIIGLLLSNCSNSYVKNKKRINSPNDLMKFTNIWCNKNKSTEKKHINFSTLFSHLGFGLLIFFISLNSIMSFEKDFNIKIGEKKFFNNMSITLESIKVFDDRNYKRFVGNINVFNKKNNKFENLKPEIRIYNQPETMTYEASIKSKFFLDTYVTMSNISKSDYYNIKFQKKPFMNLIWFSTILIAFGGFLRILRIKNL